MDDLLAQANPAIRALTPYKPGKPVSDVKRDYGLDHIIKLASNENPLGPSSKVQQALTEESAELARYPDGNAFLLKARLATLHGCDTAQITVGNGTNDLLNMIARLFLRPGVSAIYSEHAFIVYKLAVMTCGAQAIQVPALNFGHDLNAIAQSITPDTRLIFLANPNNPTGTYFTEATFTAFMQQVPADVLVVLDEAYFEYVEHANALNGVALLSQYSNLIVTRTFSKVYGLGGLRVGYSVSSEDLADLLNRHREPFNVNALAQKAALVSLDDDEHVSNTLQANREGMKLLADGLNRLGLAYIPSFANFIAINVQNGGGVAQQLLERGVIVRPVAEYDMPEYIRVTIGTAEENQHFLSVLEHVLNANR